MFPTMITGRYYSYPEQLICLSKLHRVNKVNILMLASIFKPCALTYETLTVRTEVKLLVISNYFLEVGFKFPSGSYAGSAVPVTCYSLTSTEPDTRMA